VGRWVVEFVGLQVPYVTWLIYIRDTTHLHIWHDSSIYLTCCSGPLSGGVHGSASPLCDMTHLHPWHDTSTYLTRLIHMSYMTQWAVEWWSRGSAGPALFRFWGACCVGGADGHDCQLLLVLICIWKRDVYTNATPYTWPIYVCVCIYTYIYTTQYVCIHIFIRPNVQMLPHIRDPYMYVYAYTYVFIQLNTYVFVLLTEEIRPKIVGSPD